MTREAPHLNEEQLALLASEVPNPLAEEHLVSCERCRRRWQQYVAIREAMRALPSPALPRDFTFVLERGVTPPSIPWWWRHRFSIRVGTLLAATLLVMLLSTALVLPGPSEKRALEQPAPTAIAVLSSQETPTGPGAGGEVLPPSAALEGTPMGEDTATSVSAFAAPAETPSRVTPEHEQEVIQPTGGFSRLGLLSFTVLLGIITLFGLIFGFALPMIHRIRSKNVLQ
ncbi:hypothetical protein NET03_06520 [Thermomicrobium sp. CFH 73360]|uniref:anti-sigma factor family protein n=1 Tax=Thermomicrobium sp. CFH 73360 TaxID=2951987 RepID=UPI002077630D|nr:hypothetical protein [Thermomicrobium sp. CFH 73360]MCM8746181.1 hypothetical protein [Thermomicrobium sp. CFH 73360]